MRFHRTDVQTESICGYMVKTFMGTLVVYDVAYRLSHAQRPLNPAILFQLPLSSIAFLIPALPPTSTETIAAQYIFPFKVVKKAAGGIALQDPASESFMCSLPATDNNITVDRKIASYWEEYQLIEIDHDLISQHGAFTALSRLYADRQRDFVETIST